MKQNKHKNMLILKLKKIQDYKINMLLKNMPYVYHYVYHYISLLKSNHHKLLLC